KAMSKRLDRGRMVRSPWKTAASETSREPEGSPSRHYGRNEHRARASLSPALAKHRLVDDHEHDPGDQQSPAHADERTAQGDAVDRRATRVVAGTEAPGRLLEQDRRARGPDDEARPGRPEPHVSRHANPLVPPADAIPGWRLARRPVVLGLRL